jgi:DtxR family Mn-dependent transcriptional regulator
MDPKDLRRAMVMSHARVLERHEIEHLAAELWELDEQGRNTLEDLRHSSRVEAPEKVLEQAVEKALARIEGRRVLLTERGRELAELQVRRHRLAEQLLQTVLEIENERTADRTACVMEHILSPAVTDSVCSFLGHPKFCPHGKPIPQGSCCRTFSDVVAPLVQPLRRLPVGRSARIVHVVPKHPERMVRLSNLGLVPGTVLRLQQRRPAFVVHVGETVLALDQEIGTEIYVKRLE